jgi:hypothetical protein
MPVANMSAGTNEKPSADAEEAGSRPGQDGRQRRDQAHAKIDGPLRVDVIPSLAQH